MSPQYAVLLTTPRRFGQQTEPRSLAVSCHEIVQIGLRYNGTSRTKQDSGHWHKGSTLYMKGHLGTSGSELQSSRRLPPWLDNHLQRALNKIQELKVDNQNDNQNAKFEQTQISKSKCLNAEPIPVCPLNPGLDLIFELCNLILVRIQPMRLLRHSRSSQ
jgi:hypothetical protein